MLSWVGDPQGGLGELGVLTTSSGTFWFRYNSNSSWSSGSWLPRVCLAWLVRALLLQGNRGLRGPACLLCAVRSHLSVLDGDPRGRGRRGGREQPHEQAGSY